LISSYIKEAIKYLKEGKEIKPDREKVLVIPKDLKMTLNKNSKLKKCFNEFNRGKQREFCEYITEAEREDTKLKRIEKISPLIISGIGLNDKYRS